jgi:tetratricopeptide (TPR) repeat protein
MRNSLSRFASLVGVLIFAIVVGPPHGLSAQQAAPNKDGESPPQVGLRVLTVEYGSIAQAAGLQKSDLIVKYGDASIVDAASYFAARDAYEKLPPETKVQLIYWHYRDKVVASVSPGRLGIEFMDHGMVAYQLDAWIRQLQISDQIPSYYPPSLRAKYTLPPKERLLADARATLDRARIEGTLTHAQILVDEIRLILDDAPAEEIARQTELLRELTSKYPESFTNFLGYQVFFKNKQNRPAIECYQRHLIDHPDDESVGLNLGVAYNNLRMFNEAEKAIDRVLDNKLPLGQYGYHVAFEAKAEAALGKGNYSESMKYAAKSFPLQPHEWLMGVWLLAAAENGDLDRFYEVLQTCQQALPRDYERLNQQYVAVEAFALLKSNHPDRATELISKWKNSPEDDYKISSWTKHPHGTDVVAAWKQLLHRESAQP